MASINAVLGLRPPVRMGCVDFACTALPVEMALIMPTLQNLKEIVQIKAVDQHETSQHNYASLLRGCKWMPREGLLGKPFRHADDMPLFSFVQTRKH